MKLRETDTYVRRPRPTSGPIEIWRQLSIRPKLSSISLSSPAESERELSPSTARYTYKRTYTKLSLKKGNPVLTMRYAAPRNLGSELALNLESQRASQTLAHPRIMYCNGAFEYWAGFPTGFV